MRKYLEPHPGPAIAVDEIPPCELDDGKPSEFLARLDGRWAYVCHRHWRTLGTGRTGHDEAQQHYY